MKSSLSPALVTRLKENIAGPGGLHHLDLSSSGVGTKEIAELSNCIKSNYLSCEGMAPLISIDLQGNQICGVDFIMEGTYNADSFHEFSNCLINMSKISRLKKLNLSRNYLDVRGFTILGHLLINGPQTIDTLIIRSCGGDQFCIEKLADALKVNKSLAVLDMKQNHFGTKGAEYMGDALLLNPKLRQLNISECDIDYEGMQHIARGLMGNDAIEILSMADNNIGDAGAEFVCAVLKVTKRIRNLDLAENRIGQLGVNWIASALTVNRTLVYLGLQWNDINNDGAAKLAEALASNNTLRYVYILGNYIDSDGITAMINGSLSSNTKPIDIDLAIPQQS